MEYLTDYITYFRLQAGIGVQVSAFTDANCIGKQFLIRKYFSEVCLSEVWFAFIVQRKIVLVTWQIDSTGS